MPNKFNRNYSLAIQTADGRTAVVVRPPFTVQFDIVRTTFTAANTGNIRVFNLAPTTRNKIRKNFLDTLGEIATSTRDTRKLIFSAGYGDIIPVLFQGNIGTANSYRLGTSFITEIECISGLYAIQSSFTNTSFPPGHTQREIVVKVFEALKKYGVKTGKVSAPDSQVRTTRGTTVAGMTFDISRELTQGVFIDGDTIHALGEFDCLTGGVREISDKSGIIGTPKQERTTLTLDMIFEPGLIAGQSILLNSRAFPEYNAVYKVNKIRHAGMISATTAGTAVTSLTMLNDKRLRNV